MLNILAGLILGTVVLVPIAIILWNAHPALLAFGLIALVLVILIRGLAGGKH